MFRFNTPLPLESYHRDIYTSSPDTAESKNFSGGTKSITCSFPGVHQLRALSLRFPSNLVELAESAELKTTVQNYITGLVLFDLTAADQNTQID